MVSIKNEVNKQLFEQYKRTSTLDPLSTKYIFETWKMTKELHEHMKNSKS
jgi:hypothetical protein